MVMQKMYKLRGGGREGGGLEGEEVMKEGCQPGQLM
jgi:hypothetical protein